MKKVGEKWEIMRFNGKIYRRKAELGEGFGAGCLNCDLWDLWIFGIRGWKGGRVAAAN